MTAYEMRISDWSSDVCSSDLALQQAVHDTQEVVAAARAGDLTQRIALDGKAGSVRELCDGVNALVETMANVVGRIQESTGTINSAAKEIAAGNTDLSARTEQQAAAIEETERKSTRLKTSHKLASRNTSS